jgi:hypothetical protein
MLFKVGYLFEILTWYSYLSSVSFIFWDQFFPYETYVLLVCLLAVSSKFFFFSNHQAVGGITGSLLKVQLLCILECCLSKKFDQSGCVSFGEEKSKCIHECHDVGTL